MGTMHREKIGKPITANDTDLVQLIPLGKWGSDVRCSMNVVRLISCESLNPQAAAKAVESAIKFVGEFKAHLLITPGGFGAAERKFPYGQREANKAVVGFVNEFLQLIPANRSFDVILGVDECSGWLQNSYFIPKDASLVSQCQQAWKSYPLTNPEKGIYEERYLLTKGKACPTRTARSGGWQIPMLICHDMAVFSARSRATRGAQREVWAKKLGSEVSRGSNTYVVHLIHYLETALAGGVFTNGMDNLVNGGVAGGISTFKTKLDKASQGFKYLQERTARFAGPTLDLYVQAGSQCLACL